MILMAPLFKLLVPSASELPADVRNERNIALVKVLLALTGIFVSLCWFCQPDSYVRTWFTKATIVFAFWAIFNSVIAFRLKSSRNVTLSATITTIIDVMLVAILDIVVLQNVHLDFITGPHVALYFTVIAAASLRHNAKLVRLTSLLCAILHLANVFTCYLVHDFPSSFHLANSVLLSLNWLAINDLLISLAMVGVGLILGQSTAELIESENHYNALFNSLPDGILIASSQMKILASNRKFKIMVGMTDEELLGRPLRQFFAGASPTMSIRLDADSLHEHPFARLYSESGSIPVQITQSPIEWNGQRCLELSVRDMSDRYELELALARAQKVQTVGKLAGGLAHDFNNILSGIFGAVSLSRRVIKRMDAPEEMKPFTRYLETIFDCGQTATQILERLSTFSRSSIVETATIDILDVLNDTVAIMGNTLPPNVDIKICDTTSLTVKADKTSLTQALLNLCINARDAIGAAKGTIELSAAEVPEDAVPIKFSLAPDEDYICIKVKDNGPGMDEETMQKIFDPFFTTKEKDQGTGIGLSMVYNIALVHGGAVDVMSTPGKETVFLMYIEASRDSLLPLD